MLDAVHFEQQGVPAAAILTEPFADTGQAISELQGFDDYQFATVPHPIGSLTTDEAMALADAVTPTVLNLLTDTTAQPDRGSKPANAGAAGTPATGTAPAEIVEELAAVLRADRADLTASVEGHCITLRLHIPDEACAECVLPASMLVGMFQHRFDDELGPGWSITLDDPREDEHSRSEND